MMMVSPVANSTFLKAIISCLRSDGAAAAKDRRRAEASGGERRQSGPEGEEGVRVGTRGWVGEGVRVGTIGWVVMLRLLRVLPVAAAAAAAGRCCGCCRRSLLLLPPVVAAAGAGRGALARAEAARAR